MHLEVDDDELFLLHTTGYVPSEISVYHPKSKTLFAGDTIYEEMPLTTRFGRRKSESCGYKVSKNWMNWTSKK